MALVQSMLICPCCGAELLVLADGMPEQPTMVGKAKLRRGRGPGKRKKNQQPPAGLGSLVDEYEKGEDAREGAKCVD